MKGDRAFLPHVDGLRAVAVLSVILYHLDERWLPGGFSGVDVFFVISGFIVSASVGALERVPVWRFLALFYSRRLKRIAPALIACLITTAIASAVFIPSAWLSQANQDTGFYAFFGLSNFILANRDNAYFDPQAGFNPFTHTWSLGVEEQFYFAFPFLFFAWTYPAARKFSVKLISVGLVGSLIVSAWLGLHDANHAFYMIWSRFWELAAGVLLFQWMTLSGSFDRPRAHGNALPLVSFALLCAGLWFSTPANAPFPGTLLSALGALGLLYSLHGSNHPLMSVLTNRPMLYIGKLSYSLYLWHWPVLVLFRWTVGADTWLTKLLIAGIAGALAAGSYYIIERPIRLLRIRAPHYAIVTAGLVCVFGSAWVAAKIDEHRYSIALNDVTRHAEDWYPEGIAPTPIAPGCVVDKKKTPFGPGYIATWSREHCSQGGTQTVFVIGDSHAVAYGGMFAEYAMQTGSDVKLYNNGGCPFLSMMGEEPERCRVNSEASLRDVEVNAQPDDVLFLPSLRVPRLADQWETPETNIRDALFSKEALAARASAETRSVILLRKLHDKGVRIVFAAPLPLFRSPPFRCAASYTSANPVCRAGHETTRAELDALRSPVMASFEVIARELPAIEVWDPLPAICPKATCSAFSEGRPLFFDGDHLSGYGDHVLAPHFVKFASGAPLVQRGPGGMSTVQSAVSAP